MMSAHEKCQVFTPLKTVDFILDEVDYTGDLFGKKVLESSCGEGAFLVRIVERYIIDCIEKKIPVKQIIVGLETDIVGYEVDKSSVKKCIDNLNFVAQRYGLKNTKWNIRNEDSLKILEETKFDFIIGNPPYITYSNLRKDIREYIKMRFQTCLRGSPDYYYAFIEKGIYWLNSNGKMAYLIPNNFFKNQFAQALRNFIMPKLYKIIDYKSIQLFEKKLTSSTIIFYDNTKTIEYFDYVNMETNENKSIIKEQMDDKWNFESYIEHQNDLCFGDYFQASSSVATLLNAAFVISDYRIDGRFVIVKDKKIESSLLKNASSPRDLSGSKDKKIIFPYYFIGDNLKRYTNEEFWEQYPYAKEYLEQFREKLEKRNISKNVKWFEYGRTQALKYTHKKKLLLSTVVTDKVKIYELDRNSIPYSGIYIIKKREISLSIAKGILESDRFRKYINSVGINLKGNSIRINAKVINEYRFEESELVKNV